MNNQMKQGTAYRTIVIYGFLVIMSIISIIAGYFLEHWNGLLAHILNEIGIAGLVGFLLAMTIERLSAEEFRKLAEEERNVIKTDVFHYVYGRRTPKVITDEIDTQILSSDFVRQDQSLGFVLDVVNDPRTQESYIRSKCTVNYKIRNITPDRKTFVFDHSIDKSPSSSLRDEVKYTSLVVSGCETPFELNEEQLRKKRTETETEIPLNVDQKIVVLPEQPTIVKIEYQAIRNLKGGRIYFAFTNHAYDLDLTVHAPKRDIKVFAGAFSIYPLKETDRHQPSLGYYNWRLEKPLLAYQSIYITWTPEIY